MKNSIAGQDNEAGSGNDVTELTVEQKNSSSPVVKIIVQASFIASIITLVRSARVIIDFFNQLDVPAFFFILFIILAIALGAFAFLFGISRKSQSATPNYFLSQKEMKQLLEESKLNYEALWKTYNLTIKRANGQIDWYTNARQYKKQFSRWLRGAIIAFGAMGTLAPVIASLDPERQLFIIIFGYVSLALAGVFVATDRLYGFSSGWIRYIEAEFDLKKVLSTFQYDWMIEITKVPTTSTTETSAAKTLTTEKKVTQNPDPKAPASTATATTASVTETVSTTTTETENPDPKDLVLGAKVPSPELILILKKFYNDVQTIVNDETREWAKEFQTTLTDQEKGLNTTMDKIQTKLDELKADLSKKAADDEKAGQTKADEAEVLAESIKPGEILVTVENANEFDRVEIRLDKNDEIKLILVKETQDILRDVPVGSRMVKATANKGKALFKANVLVEDVKASTLTKAEKMKLEKV